MAHFERIPDTSILIDRRPYEQVRPKSPFSATASEEIKTEVEVEANHKSHPAPEAGYYPGGSQVEGWSPLTRRTAWKVPENEFRTPKWYVGIRSPMATFFEFAARLRLPYRITLSLGVLIVGMVIAPFLPVLNWYNVPVLAVMTLFGLRIPVMDFFASYIFNPILALLVTPFVGLMWALDKVSHPFAAKDDKIVDSNKQLRATILSFVFDIEEPKKKN